MKSIFTVVVAAALLLAAVSAQAQFRGAVPSSGSLVSTSVTIAASGSTNLTATFPVGPYGVALYPTFKSGTNETTTSNLTFTVYASADGSTFTTAAASTTTVALNGTNAVRPFAIIAPTSLNNAVAAKVSVANTDSGSAVTLSALKWVSW